LAEQQLKMLLPPGLMRSMSAFFSQARNQLDEQPTALQEREWLKKVRVVGTSQPLLPPKVDNKVFEQVCAALYGDQWLTIQYHNTAGKRIQSRVMPLGLVQQGPRMYLVCRFEGYTDERNLALHRILSANESSLTFKRPPEFDLKRYEDEGRFGFGNGELIKLSFGSKRTMVFICSNRRCRKISKFVKGEDTIKSARQSLIQQCWIGGYAVLEKW
jgi:predicted DNA-binding transcriptional regulator YafY